MNVSDRIRNSCFWAAYGDALGFMTELAREPAVKQRTGRDHVDGLAPWVRRVGGKFGVDVPLPAGCYSDDTQLRLATCRAIRANGDFDVEVFASVELPVWGAYALGGGFASKEGAEALSRPGAKWCTNFFSGKRSRYIQGGGNGAAMRIHPHVWAAAPKASTEGVMRDVVRNAITTHGHPRGFVGAAFHAQCVLEALRTGGAPSPERMVELACSLGSLSETISNDRELAGMWVPLWEAERGGSLTKAVDETVKELLKDLDIATRCIRSSFNLSSSAYKALVDELGCFSKDHLGSATKTAILAGCLAFWSMGNPHECAVIAANTLGSDTDTIATMACAIAGCCSEAVPPQQTMDWRYLEYEATRLARIGEGGSVQSFKYPDLLYWQPAKRPMDYVGQSRGKWFLAGLGEIQRCAGETVTSGQFVWEWFELAFGQRVLLKHRKEPSEIAAEMIPSVGKQKQQMATDNMQTSTSPNSTKPSKVDRSSPHQLSVNEAADDVIRSGFDPKLIGAWLLQFADELNGVDKAIAFSAIVSKARNARTRRNGSSS